MRRVMVGLTVVVLVVAGAVAWWPRSEGDPRAGCDLLERQEQLGLTSRTARLDVATELRDSSDLDVAAAGRALAEALLDGDELAVAAQVAHVAEVCGA